MTFQKANVYHVRKAIVSSQNNHFKIRKSMAWLIYLIELSKTYYIILFRMKYLYVMIEISTWY